MKEEIKHIYISMLYKYNEKVKIKQNGDDFEILEFYISDQIMLCDTSLFHICDKTIISVKVDIIEDFDEVIRKFDEK